MLTYPHIDPVALKMGPLTIYWYGVMYLLGFMGAFWLCYRSRLRTLTPWTKEEIMDLFFYGAIGVIFGGTWGYLLIYEPKVLLADPLKALRFWEAGRSFHGGFIGVLCAVYCYCKLHHRRFLAVTDFIAPVVPIGIIAGRLGNFINGELWGRVTNSPFGMIFPYAGHLPRHPSQLYELGLEGIGLLVLLQWVGRKARKAGVLSGWFLLGYGVFRAIVECFREPDVQQGFILWDAITMGQLLSLPMILAGLFLIFRR